MSHVSVVSPVYFNEATLPALMERLAVMAASSAHTFEFVFVDDGSGDKSFAILSGMASSDSRVKVVRLSRNFGSNAALLAGLSYATGECAAVISADLQDPPEIVPQLVDEWAQGYEVVLAARRQRGDPLVSRLLGRAFNRLFRLLVFRAFPAEGFDFMLLNRRVVRILVDLGELNSYLFGQALWVGFRRQIIYYDRCERPGGRSRWTTARRIKYFIDAFTAFSYLPLRLCSALGFALAGAGFLYAGLIFFLYLVRGVRVGGWASLAVLVLVTSGVQLLMLGIAGEYLWRTLDAARRRPLYIVDTVINADTPITNGVTVPALVES